MNWNKSDSKGFIIGFASGLLAIIFWDVLKNRHQILNKNQEK
jgi:hypothetical protein